MDTVKEATNLVEYVIAYLQEELTEGRISTLAVNEPSTIRILVNEAIDAYEGGAR